MERHEPGYKIPSRYLNPLHLIYTCNNDYNTGGGTDGICMGASAIWCLNAKKGDYEYDPINNLEKAKELTRAYISYGKSDAKMRGGNYNHEYVNHLQERNMQHLLNRIGLPSTIVPNMGHTRRILWNITNTPGIYMMIIVAHVTAISSMPGEYYFYDNEAALYHCDNPIELADCVYQARSPNAGGSGTRQELDAPTDDTHGYGWSAVKLM